MEKSLHILSCGRGGNQHYRWIEARVRAPRRILGFSLRILPGAEIEIFGTGENFARVRLEIRPGVRVTNLDLIRFGANLVESVWLADE